MSREIRVFIPVLIISIKKDQTACCCAVITLEIGLLLSPSLAKAIQVINDPHVANSDETEDLILLTSNFCLKCVHWVLTQFSSVQFE